ERNTNVENNARPGNEYSDYFATQSRQISSARSYLNGNAGEEVFTDPDEYYSTNTVEGDQYIDDNYDLGYSGEQGFWGSNPTTVNVNYYGSPYYSNPYMYYGYYHNWYPGYYGWYPNRYPGYYGSWGFWGNSYL